MSKIDPIITNYLILREIEKSDTDFIIKLRTDEKNAALDRKENITPEIHNKWLDKYFINNNDLYFIIIDKESQKKIGTISLFNIDKISKKAELGRFIIIDRFRYLAPTAWVNVLEFGFLNLKLNKIYGFVRSKNKKAHKFNKKMLMKEEGLLKKHYWDGREYCDLIIVALFKEDYFNNDFYDVFK